MIVICVLQRSKMTLIIKTCTENPQLNICFIKYLPRSNIHGIKKGLKSMRNIMNKRRNVLMTP